MFSPIASALTASLSRASSDYVFLPALVAAPVQYRRTLASRRYQHRSRYAPHQGAQECARRVRQMEAAAVIPTLTPWQAGELDDLLATTEATGGPSLIYRGFLRTWYADLLRKRLIKWGAPPRGFDPKTYAGARLTAKGHRALEAHRAA